MKIFQRKVITLHFDVECVNVSVRLKPAVGRLILRNSRKTIRNDSS